MLLYLPETRNKLRSEDYSGRFFNGLGVKWQKACHIACFIIVRTNIKKMSPPAYGPKESFKNSKMRWDLLLIAEWFVLLKMTKSCSVHYNGSCVLCVSTKLLESNDHTPSRTQDYVIKTVKYDGKSTIFHNNNKLIEISKCCKILESLLF